MTLKAGIVIPIFNEGEILPKQIKIVEKILDETLGEKCWKIVFVDNGSSDNSAEIIDNFCLKHTQSSRKFLPNPNYGAALKLGLSGVQEDFVIILDIDQIDQNFIRQGWALRHSFDLITGSKRLNPFLCDEPRYRTFLSWGLNAVLNLMFRYPGSDTHGPKIINLKTLKHTLELCKSTRGQFDTEIVLRSFFKGFSILEFAISYQNLRKPRNFMITKIVRNLWGLLKLFYQLKHLKIEQSARYSALDSIELTRILEK
ncbi:glycosyltransferase family 2 protein [Alphaproteobacteria bacterium]|nr:glycosyltransferase family 2 protein [Alphaproteobacteria bacterium]